MARLDLPTMPVQKPDDRRVEVEQGRQQIDRIPGIVRGDDHHFAEHQARRLAMGRSDQTHQSIRRDTGVAGFWGELACLDGHELRATWSRLPDPHHEIGGFRGVGLDQLEAENPSVVDMNGPVSDRALGGLRLAFTPLGDDEQFREPGLDIDMEVEASPGLTASAADRPDDGGGGLEERAVDGEDPAVERPQRLGGPPSPVPA